MSIWDMIEEANGGTITNDVENYKVLENGIKAKEESYDMTLEIFLDNAMKRDKVEIRKFVWCAERNELPEVISTASSSTFTGELWMNGELIGPLSKKSSDIKVFNNVEGDFRWRLWINNLVKEFYKDEIKEDNKLLGKQYNTTIAEDSLNSFGKYSR